MRVDQERQALVLAIADSLGECVVAVDQEARAIFLSRSAELQLGWREGELAGRDAHAEIHPRGADGLACERFRCPLFGALRDGGSRRGEEWLMRRDGSRIPVAFKTAPVLLDGELKGWVLAFSDITEQRRTQERLRKTREHSERLEGLERAKSQFLNLASHELRGPLAVIAGYTSMLRDGTLGPLSSRQAAALPVIEAKIQQMESLVGQMLDSARLDDDRLELDRKLRDLRELVDAAFARVREAATSRHRLDLRLPAFPVLVEVDEMRLTTIVQNLLDNAVKYSPDGGRVECSVSAAGGCAGVAVRDEGIGIGWEDRDRLFTRFGRLAGADHDGIPGTGLGLYLARELARRHGGDIIYESRPGVGSLFILEVPLAGPPAERESA